LSEPTIIWVLGMHRSGTSLVAQLMHALGLDMGPEDHLMGPSPANPTGHWENEPISEINDELLARLRGSWLDPPIFPAGWERWPELDDIRRRARDVINQEFGGSKAWGFKDPRTCLTLPFWQRLLPPMRYVVCLRNPLDVAFSLEARESEPVTFDQGADLWLTYVRASLAASAGHPQQILFYEDLMSEPEPVVRKLARFISGGKPSKSDVRAAIRVANRGNLWHHRTPLANVIDESRLPFHVKSLYLALRLFQPGEDDIRVDLLELLGGYALEAGQQRRELDRALEVRHGALERMTDARDKESQHRERSEAALQEARAQMAAMRDEVEAIRAAGDEARAQLQAAHARLETLGARFEEQREELIAARSQARQLEAALEDRPQLPPAPAGEPVAPPPPSPTGDPAYVKLLDDVRTRAREVIPEDATILVASHGDEHMLQLEGRHAWHFPLGSDDGRWLGYHPAGDTAVIAQLEALRAGGADHLLLPGPILWWLDHYHGFRRHLEDRYVELLHDDRCAIYALRPEGRQAASGVWATLERAVATLRSLTGRDPSVLEWDTGLDVARHLPELPAFAPPSSGDTLPYLDDSVDVVVLEAGDDGHLAEARRVATSAVIAIDPEFPDAAGLEWLAGTPKGWGEDVSITLLPDASDPSWAPSVGAFMETLPAGFAGDFTVLGAPADLERATAAGTAAGVEPRLIEASTKTSFAKRARKAADVTGDRVQIFVTRPAVPLPGWLPPILALFSHEDSAGVVGTRILSRFGALQEAGGVLAPDGSRRRRGEGDQDPDRPEYCFVRRVDFCSPPVLATTLDALDRLRGFKNGRSGADDAVVDFALRAGQSGVPVFYQPQARVVQLAGKGR
jgi:hypothetical protein